MSPERVTPLEVHQPRRHDQEVQLRKGRAEGGGVGAHVCDRRRRYVALDELVASFERAGEGHDERPSPAARLRPTTTMRARPIPQSTRSRSWSLTRVLCDKIVFVVTGHADLARATTVRQKFCEGQCVNYCAKHCREYFLFKKCGGACEYHIIGQAHEFQDFLVIVSRTYVNH